MTVAQDWRQQDMTIEILFQRMETFCHWNLREPDSRTWKPNKVLLHSAFSFHQVCMAKISIVSLVTFSPSEIHKLRRRGIWLALETLCQARGLVQPHGTPAKVPKLISFFGTLDLRTTKVVIRGVHVLIEGKHLKVSWSHKMSKSVMAWIEQLDFDLSKGTNIEKLVWKGEKVRKGHNRQIKQQSKRNWISAG